MNAPINTLFTHAGTLTELAVFIRGLEEQDVAPADYKEVIDAYLKQEQKNIDAATAYFGRPR